MNTNQLEPEKLKEIMELEKLNWRSFGMSDAILANWNDPGTPMYYFIDHTGVIRYKWFGTPGEKAIDAAVETLIEKASRK